ncbi:MAG: penicillin-binding transpeptidase domain-containing protein, partial [Oscillospiraceae bacterium]
LEVRQIAGVRYEMEKTGFSVSTPYTFAKNVDIQTVFEIKERRYQFTGVDVIETANREYVDGVIAPHIIGRVGPIYKEEYEQLKDKGYKLNDTLGKDGIEKMMESVLKGTDGEHKIIMNKNREVVEVIDEKAPKPGNSVFLTIDKDIQYAAQIALQNKIESMRKTQDKALGKDAQGGSVAVIDIKKGEVLALANYPSFDLSTFAQDYDELIQQRETPIFNRALDGQYMPGSIFKPVVALAGISEGLITSTTTVDCQYVYRFYEDYQPTCAGGYHGHINVYDAMRVSCNTFFYDIGRQLGIEKINEYAKILGLGLPTGIELPEKNGRLSTPEYRQKIGSTWFSGNILQVSIGQLDTEITPLQLANFMAILANKGKKIDLSIIKEIRNYDLSETIYQHTPIEENTFDVSEQAYDMVIDAMVQTSRTGSARAAFADYPFDVAAKTGTPQNGYDWTNATFVAFAPADDPQIAVAVVVEKGGGGHLISDVAKEIFDAYFFPNKINTQTQLENNLIS